LSTGESAAAAAAAAARSPLAAGAAEVVLFDLDGVIADSRHAITSCMNAALVARGHAARPEAELRGLIGPSLSFGFVGLIGADQDDPAVADLVRAYRERYVEVFVEETPAYPGVIEAIEALADGRRLGIATSKPRRFAEPLLEALGVRSCFDVVAAPALDIHVESKSATVAAALGALGDVPAGAMVGDRHVDIRAAHDHGLRAIGVLWGFGTEEELREAGADVLVAAPASLARALGSCFAGWGRLSGLH
jgi:phosphoglycolate phosphatase